MSPSARTCVRPAPTPPARVATRRGPGPARATPGYDPDEDRWGRGAGGLRAGPPGRPAPAPVGPAQPERFRPRGRRPPPRPRRAWGKWGRRTVTGAFGLAALKAAADAVRDPFVEEAYFMENGHLVAVAEDGSRMDLGPDPTGRKWMELGLGGR